MVLPSDVLRLADQLGLAVEVDAGQLHLRPAEQVTQELRCAIRRCRPALLRTLCWGCDQRHPGRLRSRLLGGRDLRAAYCAALISEAVARVAAEHRPSSHGTGVRPIELWRQVDAAEQKAREVGLRFIEGDAGVGQALLAASLNFERALAGAMRRELAATQRTESVGQRQRRAGVEQMR